MRDDDYVTELQLDQYLQHNYATPDGFVAKRLKQNLFGSVRMLLGVHKQDVSKAAPCGGSFSLLQFDYQIKSKQEDFSHYLIRIESFPLL